MFSSGVVDNLEGADVEDVPRDVLDLCNEGINRSRLTWGEEEKFDGESKPLGTTVT